MSASLERIEAAVVDGRAQTPRHIQKQLLALYNALVRSLAAIQQAISEDSGSSAPEAWLETSLVLEEVKTRFSSIKLDDFLAKEYSIASGQNRPTRRRPHGSVYIVPSSVHTRLYSIVQPAVVAIATGSCVVLELSPDSSAVDKVIAEALGPVMDKDTFAIVTQRPQGDLLSVEHTIIAGDAEHDIKTPSSHATILQSAGTATVAVVDRTANIEEAAQHIVRARFSFRAQSPYAPDVVLVNEFVVDEFCQAAVKLLTGRLPSLLNGSAAAKSPQTKSAADGILLVSTSRGSIELVANRDQISVAKKTKAPLLIVHPFSSLDDAIDTALETASSTSTPATLLALYLFADPKSAKYLSQFIGADVSLTNYIPPQLLVGPAAPSQYPVSISGRYTPEMLSSPSPELIVPTKRDHFWTNFLDGKASRQEVDKIKAETSQPLPDIGEPDGKATGFFEQGFQTGLIIEAFLISGIVAIGARYAISRLLR